jgi:hypothetical protein
MLYFYRGEKYTKNKGYFFHLKKLPKENSRPMVENSSNLGRFFVHFFQGKFRGKFSSKKCWENLQFSVEKVLKNHYFNKFHGIFRGKSLSAEKNVRKIGPWSP